MSRNDTIRKLADAMPTTAQVKGGDVVTDGYNHPLTVNHFRVMKQIEKEQGKDAVAQYVNNILLQEQANLVAEKERLQRIEDRKRTLRILFNSILGTAVLISLIIAIQWLTRQ